MKKLVITLLLLVQTAVAGAYSKPSEQLQIGGRFTLWNPADRNPAVGYTYKACENPILKNHIVGQIRMGEDVPASCAPDTLYSWGDQGKLDWYVQNLGDSKPWPQKIRALYTTPSASGSFFYGPIALRLKIKPGVRFKLTYDNQVCTNADDDALKNTVWVASWKLVADGTDYILCGTDVIESWSYGTPEHYDEVAKDANWMLSHAEDQYMAYAKYDARWVGPARRDELDFDGHPVSFRGFQSQMETWASTVDDGREGIFFNSGAKQSRAQHFATKHPIYFNEY